MSKSGTGVSNFNEDLDHGKVGEVEMTDVLRAALPDMSVSNIDYIKDPQKQRSGVDIELGSGLTFDVKHERSKHIGSPNLPIESWSKWPDTPGWMYTSVSDYVIWLRQGYDGNLHDDAWLMKHDEELKSWFNDNKSTFQERDIENEGYTTRVHLVPIESFPDGKLKRFNPNVQAESQAENEGTMITTDTVPEEKASRPIEATVRFDALEFLINTAASVHNEGRITFSDNEIWFDAVEPSASMVCYARHQLDESDGESLEGGSLIGVDFNRFSDALTTAKAHADVNDGLVDLSIDVGKINIDSGRFHYELSGIQPDALRQPHPLQKFRDKHDTTFRIGAELFYSGINSVALTSEHVGLMADENNFSMLGKGDLDESTIEVPFEHNYEAESTMTCVGGKAPDEEILSKFGTTYFEDIESCLSGTFNLGLSDEYPVVIDSEEKCDVSFLLSPRVER